MKCLKFTLGVLDMAFIAVIFSFTPFNSLRRELISLLKLEFNCSKHHPMSSKSLHLKLDMVDSSKKKSIDAWYAREGKLPCVKCPLKFMFFLTLVISNIRYVTSVVFLD